MCTLTGTLSPMAVQRVRRVIRKVDPWSVLKVSLVFDAVMALVFVLGGVIFWAIFVNAGIPDKINELALLIDADREPDWRRYVRWYDALIDRAVDEGH